MRGTDQNDPLAQETPRKICTGTPEQVLEDLEKFAEAGDSLVVAKMDCPSGEVQEILEQLDRVGQDIIPESAKIEAFGDWRTDI